MKKNYQTILKKFCFALLFASFIFSCDKDEKIEPIETYPSSAEENTVIFNDETYLLENENDLVFTANTYSEQVFKLGDKKMDVLVVLPNTNPFSGIYKPVMYAGSSNEPGTNEISMQVRTYDPNSSIYISTVNSTGTVDLTNKNDTIVLKINKLTLFNGNEETILTATIKIARKRIEATYVGSATFTSGSANSPSYKVISENLHRYEFSSKSIFSSWATLTLSFSDEVKTGTYKAVQKLYPSAGEVNITILTPNLENWESLDSDKTLSVIIDPDGKIRFDFSDVDAIYYDRFNNTTKEGTIFGSANMIKKEVDQPN